ncbi:MAG TPA: hypothetical protein VNE40_02175 [Candidatus Dormibacteraeota bacterium]|nr:hypothetical protein [Candidatus Dormibacteraeota bacterium]
MHNNIKKDYLWNTIGVFAQNAISPLLLIVITRINGIYDSGVFSFAFSVAIIFWAVGMWGGRTHQASDVKHEFSHRSYIMVRLVLGILIFLGAITFDLINRYNVTKSSIIVALVLFKAVESIADSLYGILQVHGYLFSVGKSLLYKAVSGFSLFMFIDIYKKNILLGSLGIVLVNIGFVLLYDLRIAKRLENIHIKVSQINYYTRNAGIIMKRCAPIFAVLFLAMFSLNIPRYFIDLYHGEQIGYFGIIAMPITLIVLLMSFVLQPNVVSLSRLYKKGKYIEFHKIVKRIAYIVTFIGAIILVTTFILGVPVLKFVFGINFSGYKLALIIMVAGGVVNALVALFINILIIMRQLKDQFYILLVTNVVLGILSATLVRKYGLLGGVSLFATINILQISLLSVVYRMIVKRVTTNAEN